MAIGIEVDDDAGLGFVAVGNLLFAGLEALSKDDRRQVEDDAERRVVVDREFVEPDYG